jgi:CBS domain-containing protein
MSIVRDILSTKLVSVGPSATVAEAATVMGERHVGSALVMEGESLIGIFTERDIVRALSQDFDAPGHSVSPWMTKNPKTIGAEADVKEALDMMLTGGFRHVPVVDGERVVGIISMRDISKASAEQSR